MINTNKYLSMIAILVSAVVLNGCIVNPDNSPRSNNNHYQHDNANYNNNSGNRQPSGAHFKDLQGVNAISGFDRMAERGFNNVDYLESGNTQYSIYYNHSTRQCIQLTVANNQILSADDIHTHPNCR